MRAIEREVDEWMSPLMAPNHKAGVSMLSSDDGQQGGRRALLSKEVVLTTKCLHSSMPLDPLHPEKSIAPSQDGISDAIRTASLKLRLN